MSVTKKWRLGAVASAVAGGSLLAGGLLFGAPWASAQTPAPSGPSGPAQQQPGMPGEPRDGHDCPKHDGAAAGQQGAAPGGTGLRGGPRTLRQ